MGCHERWRRGFGIRFRRWAALPKEDYSLADSRLAHTRCAVAAHEVDVAPLDQAHSPCSHASIVPWPPAPRLLGNTFAHREKACWRLALGGRRPPVRDDGAMTGPTALQWRNLPAPLQQRIRECSDAAGPSGCTCTSRSAQRGAGTATSTPTPPVNWAHRRRLSRGWRRCARSSTVRPRSWVDGRCRRCSSVAEPRHCSVGMG